jgi:DNA-binding phage protein
MALTRAFKDTVKARAERDPAFRDALLTEGVDALLAGDMDIGKAILRDYINATVGFDKLAEDTGTPAKSLMRMFGPRGNLFSIIHRLQSASGVSLHVRPSR